MLEKVSFTCNNCYETVAVDDLEPHLTKCESPVQFKCVRCLSEFDDCVAKSHVECTKTQKQTVNVATAGEPAKEQSMQEKWVSFLQSIPAAKLSGLSAEQTKAFNELKTLKNVPRNELKFANFLQVAQKGTADDAKAIWTMILHAKTSDLTIAFTEIKDKKVSLKRKRSIAEVDADRDGPKPKKQKKPLEQQPVPGQKRNKAKAAKKQLKAAPKKKQAVMKNGGGGGGNKKNKIKRLKKK